MVTVNPYGWWLNHLIRTWPDSLLRVTRFTIDFGSTELHMKPRRWKDVKDGQIIATTTICDKFIDQRVGKILTTSYSKFFLGNKSAIGLIPCGSNYKAHQNSALESHLWWSYVELKKILGQHGTFLLVSLKATEFLCQETVEPWKFHHRDKPFGSLWPVGSSRRII